MTHIQCLFNSALQEKSYPYLYLDAAQLKVNRGSDVDDLALLVAIGVNEQGYREVLTIESTAGTQNEAYRHLLRGLVQRGLGGVQLIISDDQESITAAIRSELPAVRWQRCLIHFERTILCHVPATEMAEITSDLRRIFSVDQFECAWALVDAFVIRYEKRFPKAVAALQKGIADALTFLSFPVEHHRLLQTKNGSERLFGEIKRRTRVIGVFPSETNASHLCTNIILRASEEWAFQRYLDMATAEATIA